MTSPAPRSAPFERLRVLVIPHACPPSVKTRSLELAKALAGYSEVFYLGWQMYPAGRGPAGIAARLAADFRNLAAPRWASRKIDGVIHLSAPVATGSLAARAGLLPAIQAANRGLLAGLLAAYRIDVLINSNAQWFSCPSWSGSYVYDLPDDPVGELGHRNERDAARLLRRELREADLVTAVSHSLAAKISRLYPADPVYLPNGANWGEIEAARHGRDRLRGQLGLDGKFVLGFIGNHAAFAGLPFLFDVFAALRRRTPDTALLIAGPIASEAERREALARGAVLTGPVAPGEIAAYCHAMDVAVLPFVPYSFTDNALPMKVVEAAAARKMVVASPLAELCRLGLSHVILAGRNVPAWVEAIERTRATGWDPRWDRRLREFDWYAIAGGLIDRIQAIHQERKQWLA